MKACSFFTLRVLSSIKNPRNGSFSSTSLHQMKCRSIHAEIGKRKDLRIGIQGAGMFAGQLKQGVEMGANVLRETGLEETLTVLGHDVKDYGDVPVMELQDLASTPTMKDNDQAKRAGPATARKICADRVKQVSDAAKLISIWTAKIMRDGRICLTIGGDHSLAIGTVYGASKVYPDLAVLWVDAHADINTPFTSISGNIHGMAVSFILKELKQYVSILPEFSSWIQPNITVPNFAYIGLRDVEPLEATLIKMMGIAAYSMRDIDCFGIQKVTEMALDTISKGNTNRPIHMSYDIDTLCESIVKSTGTPVIDGISSREGTAIAEMVHNTGRLVSMDLVELNPMLGTASDVVSATQAAKRIILGAFGNDRCGNGIEGDVPQAPFF